VSITTDSGNSTLGSGMGTPSTDPAHGINLHIPKGKIMRYMKIRDQSFVLVSGGGGGTEIPFTECRSSPIKNLPISSSYYDSAQKYNNYIR
jgi:hypothetical protein